jgi:hypothetical protein
VGIEPSAEVQIASERAPLAHIADKRARQPGEDFDLGGGHRAAGLEPFDACLPEFLGAGIEFAQAACIGGEGHA